MLRNNCGMCFILKQLRATAETKNKLSLQMKTALFYDPCKGIGTCAGAVQSMKQANNLKLIKLHAATSFEPCISTFMLR